MKKIKKGTQFKLVNPRNAGRKAIHDKGIRHTSREFISRPSALHLTVKLKRADIQNKVILRILKHAIYRSRLQGIRIVHFTLEHDHVHLYAECGSNLVLAKGMKAFGVTLVKGINKLKRSKGTLYKYRFHLRILKTPRDAKNVINYILKNGIKHRRTLKVINPYNSALALHDFGLLKIHLKRADIVAKAERFLKKAEIDRELNLLRVYLDEIIIFKKEMRWV